MLGLQLGARAYQEDRQRETEMQKKQLEEAELTRRYDLQLRNSAAMKAMELAAKAEEFKNQNSVQRRKTYNEGVTKNAFDVLDDEEKYLSDYLKPENVSKISNASQIRARIKQIRINKSKVAKTLPGDDGFIDESTLIDAPRELVEPILSPEYKASVAANQQLPAERLKGTQLRNEKLENTPDPAEKEHADKLEKIATMRNKFIGVTNSAYGAMRPYSEAYKKYGDKQVTRYNADGSVASVSDYKQRWSIADPEGYKAANSAYEKARQEWTVEAPSILSTLEDPDVSEPDVIQVVKSTKGQYNNLRTFDDFNSWIGDLNKRDYSGSPAARKAVIKLNQYLLNQGGVQ